MTPGGTLVITDCSSYLPGALEELRAAAERLLKAERLQFADLKTLGTPRRLTLFVGGLATRQADIRREVTGPPKSVAFDAVDGIVAG